MKGTFAAVVAVLALTLLATSARAQVLYGSIVGTVTDTADLAVPGATVKITHVETNQSRETTSNETGGYNFPNVAAGTYQVEVTLPGFQTFQAREIAVRLNAAVRVDARLSVGALQESVLVSADSVLLQTETAAVQTQTTSQQLQNLPINGRSFQSMLTLTPGVAQPNYFQTGGINNPARSMQVTVNGAPNSNTVFRLDGVSATNQWIQGLQAYTPAIEAIESVNVVTNSFDAEQGMAGGASVNVQIKSGTNAPARLGVPVPLARRHAVAQLLPARRSGQDEGHQERVRRHHRRSDQARQGCSTSSASKTRCSGRSAGRM